MRENVLKIPPRKKDNSTPISSILKSSMAEGKRAVHTKIGLEAETRVASFLSEIYGARLVVHGGKSADGRAGRPDVLLKTDPLVLVEVKTCTLFHLRRIFGAAKTFRHSWERLTRYARDRRMKRIMVIEYRHKGAYIYVWIKGEEVDRMIKERLAASEKGFDVFHFDFKQACEYGNILTKRGFEIDPVESPQQKIDGFTQSGS